MDRFGSAAVEWAAGSETAQEVARGIAVNRVVLVEGVSDVAAALALALRRGLDLEAGLTCVIPMGGATNISRFLELLGPPGLDLQIGGLCDAREERYFRRAAERTGLAANPDRSDMESLGFFVCDADLEDELIRALGTTAVEGVIESLGDLEAFRTFQNQPAQRVRPIERQLRRFMGTLSGRKEKYARALVDALDLDEVPRPLDLLVARF